MRQWRWWTLPAVVAVALAGCGSSPRSSGGAGGSPTGTTQSSSTTQPSSTTRPTTTTGSTTTPGGTTSPTTTAGQGQIAECSASDLAGSVGPGNGAAGTSYYQLKLRNSSSGKCFEQGYAGVSLLDSAGRQIGAAADRVSAETPKVVLSPGATADATLSIAEAGNYPSSSCSMKPATALRVYPPDQTASLTIPFRSQGCARSSVKLLHIKPFTAAPGR